MYGQTDRRVRSSWNIQRILANIPRRRKARPVLLRVVNRATRTVGREIVITRW